MRLLTFTTLYPHAGSPNQGVFVENRLRHLVESGEVSSTVLAPVPWFPSSSSRFGRWAQVAGAPGAEQRHGISVLHPRFAVIPKFGMSMAPGLLYASAARAVRRLLAEGAVFDAIDAHYFYPDGVAAAMLARRFNLPLVVTARGSDITQLPDYALPRRMIQWAMARADAMISVSAGLRRAMMALGADGDAITVLRNGVDLHGFRPPEDRDATRAELGLHGPALLSVGHLIERKGHDLAIGAMAHLPGWSLLVVGEGPERPRLEGLISRLGLGDRVRLLGAHPHEALRRFYGAADLLILASSREGWANVLLEAMACGTPVVASDIPGNDEVVQTRDAGLIATHNTPEGFAAAVQALWADPPVRDRVRRYAEGFSWDDTTQGQRRVFAAARQRFSERNGTA